MSEKQVHAAETNTELAQLGTVWNKYQKQILMALGALVVVIGGWYAYQNWFAAPKEEQAADAIYKAEANFAKDSLNAALKGDATSKGFLYIINNYGGTKSSNLAKYYAGVCYLRTGDFNNAVKYLQGFSTDAPQIQMMAYGCLADAYSELGKNDEAISNYKKASAAFEKDEPNSSEYLFRAALKLELTGKTNEAIELYKELKEKFPQTQRGGEADKYLYRLTVPENDFSSK
ncbi:MAG TPA: tetratricopeptide repeat protein [Panacibacter sp.]|nr:tetratricopeptide repeat protein [Panacibacter sp.]